MSRPCRYVRVSGDAAYEHVAVAERALGKPLPAGAHVHHVNEDPTDNRTTNLIICQDNAYHKLLHVRLRVLRAGGVPGRDKVCGWCGGVKPMTEFVRRASASDGFYTRCRSCHAALAMDRWRRRKDEAAREHAE